MALQRVVVTGLGAITPVGKGAPEFWNGLVSGKSGVSPIKAFDATPFPTRFAGQVENFDPTLYMDKKEARRMDRFSHFAIAAADEAIKDSGLNLETVNKDRVGVMIGTGIGGMLTFYEQSVSYYKDGPRGISPYFITMMIPNMASGNVAIRYGFRGVNYCAVSACATGAHNIGLAFDAIRLGQVDIVVCGGTEAPITEIGVGGFCAIKAMSTRNDAPEKASRPFDKDRDGFVLAEGSAVVVLESLKSAIRRGARIYSEVVGYGFSCDAYHVAAPDPESRGVVLAMNQALQSAGIRPEDVDHINMHGTSTPLGDVAETRAIKKVFGEHAYKINLNSTKSMTGHTLGAAGAVESVAALLTTYHGIIPPTINLDNQDPECDLNYTANKAVVRDVRYAINNAFGFGGHNTSVVFKKFEE
jgi:3-oxoacyl-[acyl-carrier-protein] synthase II